ncbi:MAG: hypothetical protein M1830_001325 [Pleopsidium flavum]|nr:MAG: hypothetical protein M1830_001325 [Pleopsidium flavum]
MATSRSSPPQMPFGCESILSVPYTPNGKALLILSSDSFHGIQDFPHHPPPVPAPGPALLDDSESNMLDTFFDTLGTTHFDNNDFFLDKPLLSKNEGDPSFNWADDLPPTFHGSTTSLSQPAMVSHGLSDVGYGRPSGLTHASQDADSKTTSAEVLAAASTLIRNGQSSQNNGIYAVPIFPAHDIVDGLRGNNSSGSSSGTQSMGSYSNILPVPTQQRSSGFLHEKPAPPIDSGETLFHDMYFGTSSQVRANFNHAPKQADIQWGSDISFLDHGFVAPPNQETEEEVTKTLMHKMECLEPQGSASSTRLSSPTITRRREPMKRMANDNALSTNNEESTDEGEVEEQRPMKRRKSNFKHGADREEDTTHSGARLKNSKTAVNGKGTRLRRSNVKNSLPKRRNSQSGEPKSNRENLTEEQKRSNHIVSEQKRRNLIKQGFEDLCKLVPELKGGGFSKSAMLIQAADWLENIIKGNEVLKAQLIGLEGKHVV